MTRAKPGVPDRDGRVVVVGAINVDLVVATDRLPGPGETVVGGPLQRYGGGKGANAAVAAARAGGRVSLVGAVGADDNGRSALAELRDQGIDVGSVAVLEDQATGVALIVVSADGENQIAVGAGANLAVTPEHVGHALAAALPSAGCVLVSTEISPAAVAAAVRLACAAGVPCVLNPAPVLPVVLDVLSCGPMLTPNATESAELAAMLAGGEAEHHDRRTETAGTETAATKTAATKTAGAQAAAELLAARTGALVIVTLGGDGALLLEPGSSAVHVPPWPAEVRDTTGAGDTFNGVLARGLAAGAAVADAVRAATVAAALSVAHSGARPGMPDAAAIAAALGSVPSAP
jgi:ribokinase